MVSLGFSIHKSLIFIIIFYLNEHFYCAYYLPGIVLSSLQIWAHLISFTILWDRITFILSLQMTKLSPVHPRSGHRTVKLISSSSSPSALCSLSRTQRTVAAVPGVFSLCSPSCPPTVKMPALRPCRIYPLWENQALSSLAKRASCWQRDVCSKTGWVSAASL